MQAIGNNIICISAEVEQKVGSLILSNKAKPKFWEVVSKGVEVKEVKLGDKVYVLGGSIFDYDGKDYLFINENQVLAII